MKTVSSTFNMILVIGVFLLLKDETVFGLVCTSPTCMTYGTVTLFAAGGAMIYEDSMKNCVTKGGKPYLPKTLEDNVMLQNYSKTVAPKLKPNGVNASDPWYNKKLNEFSGKYIWADGQVHDDFYLVTGTRIYGVNANANGDLCFQFNQNGTKPTIWSRQCESRYFYSICQFIP